MLPPAAKTRFGSPIRKSFERDGRVYRWLGVPLFKMLLMRSVQPDPSARKSNGYTLMGRSLAAVRDYDRCARRNEVKHLALLGLSLAFFAFTMIWGALLIPGLIVFVTNFHCVLLQRFNRVRVYRILKLAERLE